MVRCRFHRHDGEVVFRNVPKGWWQRKDAHFLRATHGVGAVIAMLGRRAPEVRHVRRWTAALFAEATGSNPSQLLVGWFATGGAGLLFLPSQPEDSYCYHEIGRDTAEDPPPGIEEYVDRGAAGDQRRRRQHHA
jgi:hypothetical protein